MEKLTLLATDFAPWIKWTIANSYWLVPVITILILFMIILNYVLSKKHKKPKKLKDEYGYISCNGRMVRSIGGTKIITYRKGVYVRININTGMHYWQDHHKNWHMLRKIHRDQIIESSKNRGIPEFDIPIRIKKAKAKEVA